jgi:hypothetical protein
MKGPDTFFLGGTMVRRRCFLGLGLLAILLLTIPLLVLCLGRSEDSVNARTIARLELGMTEREVERVLGRPADSEAVLESEVSGQVKRRMAKQWAAPGGRDVRVAFDDAGKTSTIVEGVPPPAGVFDRLREWSGF